MDLAIQLWQLGLSMPPIVSAIISMLCFTLVWFGGKKILAKIEHQAAPIMAVLGEQSKELKTQSEDLVKIKVQTTKTNGKVELLETVLAIHEAMDNDHHAETVKRLDNKRASIALMQTTIYDLRDQLSDFAIKVGLQAKRINTRDDAIGESSHKEE